jgi:gliding motility-associated-like protein
MYHTIILCLLVVVTSFSLCAQSVVSGPFGKRNIIIPDSGEVRLIAYPPLSTYHWSTGWKTPVIFVNDTGWVWVDVNMEGQVLRDSVYLKLPCVVMPNTLTPNSEVYYDYCLMPRIHCELDSFKLSVFDRWGNIVFETSDAKECWDGTQEDRHVPGGTYIYRVNWKEPDSLMQTMTGNLTLIR